MDQTKQKFLNSLKWPVIFVAVLLVVHLVQSATNGSLGIYGVFPRNFKGLIGIITAPLIHGDFPHLFSNSAPLLLLGTMIFYFYRSVAMKSILLIYFLSGLAVWLFAREVLHIGASGVVYGLVSFVFWNGIFRRNLKSIVLALVVTVLYSGYFLGLIPHQEGISWESHLFGAIAGIIASYLYKEQIENDEIIEEVQWDDEEEVYFLPRDIFERTKEERRLEQLRLIEEQRLAREEAMRKAREDSNDWFSNSTF